MAQELEPPQQASAGRVALGVTLNVALAVWFFVMGIWAAFFSMATDVCTPEDCERIARVVDLAYRGVQLVLMAVFVLASWKAWSQRTIGGLVLVFLGAAVIGPIVVIVAGSIVEGARG